MSKDQHLKEEFLKKLTKILVEKQKEYGTLKELCFEKRLNQTHLSNLLNGRANFTLNVLFEILVALDCKILIKKDK